MAVAGGQSTPATAAGYTSNYRLWSATGAAGLVVYLDGTGEYGYENPDSGYVLGGSGGLVAAAASQGMATLALQSPDASCACWHSGDMDGYADWAAAVITGVAGTTGGPVWLTGFSSGAQEITRAVVPRHPQLIVGGGIVVVGGGGPPSGGGLPDLSGTRGHWWTGTADTSVPLTASHGAAAGEQAYAAAGMTTSIETPQGVGHTVEALPEEFLQVVAGS